MNQSVLECQRGFERCSVSRIYVMRTDVLHYPPNPPKITNNSPVKSYHPQRKVPRNSNLLFLPQVCNATLVNMGENFAPNNSNLSGLVTSLGDPRHRYKQIFWVSDTCQAATLQNQFGKLSPVKCEVVFFLLMGIS